MFSKNTVKVVLFLLKNINEYGYNINQVSKNLDISVGSSFKVLKDLEKENIVYHKNINNATNYKLNLENEETIKICEYLLLAEKRKSEIKLDIKLGDLILYYENKLLIISDKYLDKSVYDTKPIILTKDKLVQDLKDHNKSIIKIIRQGIVLKGESFLIEVLKLVNS